MMKKISMLIGAVLVVGVFVFLAISGTSNQQTQCTKESKICPDGSSVGRIGKDCQFAECPAPASSIRLQSSVGMSITGLNVTITPLEVTEDSRCPEGVQCVWAGTVKVRSKIQSGLGVSEMILELGTAATTEAETIMLAEVMPSPKAGVKIPPSSYRFTFDVKKR